MKIYFTNKEQTDHFNSDSYDLVQFVSELLEKRRTVVRTL